MVLLNHLIFSVPRYWPTFQPDFRLSAGVAGVDFFFVLSGFIMVFISETKERAPLDFFRHRLIRVAPPYWIVTIALGLALLAAPSLFEASRFDLHHLAASLLFVPYPHPTIHEDVPVYVPGWTLNYEFFFYSLFAVAIAVRRDQRDLIVSLALLLLVWLGAVRSSNNQVIAFYTNPILLEFIFGVAIGATVVRGIRIPPVVAYALIVLGLVAFAVLAQYYTIGRLSGWRPIIYGIPAALLVAGLAHIEIFRRKAPISWLAILGDSSYSIYLTHFILAGPLLRICKTVGLNNAVISIVICFSIIIAISVAFHFAIEKPLVARFRNPSNRGAQFAG